MRRHITVFIVLLVVICIFIVINKEREIKEPFASHIAQPLLNTVYQSSGIERCEQLFADPINKPDLRESLSQKALETMDNFTLGFRMRELVPKEKTLANASNVACYMLFDSNNGAIDPILKGLTCDMNNNLFQDIGFIKNVRIDTDRDISHVLPYAKCVLDIDPAQIDSASLNTFWGRAGTTQCDNYGKALNSNIKTLVHDLSTRNNELISFQDLDPKLTACLSNQYVLTNVLKDYNDQFTLSNCAFNGHCANVSIGSRETMSNEYKNLTDALNKGTNDRQSLTSAITRLQTQTRNGESQFTEQELVYSSSSNSLVRCSNVDLPEQNNNLSELNISFKGLTNSSNLALQQLNKCKDGLNVKLGEYQQLIYNTNAAQAAYTGSNNQLITCLSTNDYLRKSIAMMKDQFQKFSTMCNDCTSAVVMDMAELDALLADNRQLEIDRDDWIRRCTYDQSKMLDLSVRSIDALRTSASQYTRQNCGNDMQESQDVNDLIQQKFSALASLNQPVRCDEATRVPCCKSRGFQ
jgi:hypothetical protein